jgi:NAD+ diphosphatase
MTGQAFRFCPSCATPLQLLAQMEDGGEKQRLRCPACGWTHWNNPTPVLAAVIEYRGQILLARNAAWPGRMFALITGFMEAGETPQGGIAREIKEETNLDAVRAQPDRRVRLPAHEPGDHCLPCRGRWRGGAVARAGRIQAVRLPGQVKCWPAGTGYALADWLRGRGYNPEFVEFPKSPRTE